ncbi:excalibur calcium-binding domain-containing protein [Patescibacteria group bacterium]|nr:excalibur calcium-binding domain-containing protein [Patescibacteria group bacterium]MBU4017155.1 excalibur calcium-binding domain-containing protein [Patescibacteria group bacterium]MBU4098245.1 excalibur calcium-binding domain-containing protein [Patescibacteria group bacterium]
MKGGMYKNDLNRLDRDKDGNACKSLLKGSRK